MRNLRELKPLAPTRLLLERNGARNDAPVDFGQHDMHGEIGRAEAARRSGPLLSGRAGQDDLQHGRIGGVENAAARIETRRESRRVEDDVERRAR